MRASSACVTKTMNKPQSIRQFLQTHVPALNQRPDNFLTFIEGGQLVCTRGPSPSFMYHYKLTLAMLEYADHADTLMIPILIWINQHQPELLNGEANGHMTFEAEILNNTTADITVTLDLTERVVARLIDDTIQAYHCPEPVLDQEPGPTQWEMFAGNVQVQATPLP